MRLILRLSIRTLGFTRGTRHLLLAVIWVCATWVVRPATSWAQPSPTTVARKTLAPLIRYRLPNGLRVVLDIDSSAQDFATCLAYPLGSRDDPEGQEGAAWLLERVLSARPASSRRSTAFVRLEKAGGSSEGAVGTDATTYTSVGPSAALAHALELEAARLARPIATPRDFPELRRAAIAKQGSGSELELMAERRLRQLVFQGHGPYSHLVEGTPSVLSGLDLAALVELHDRRMRLGGAVLSIVGGFSEREARRLVQQSFARAAVRGGVEESAPLPMPRQTSERFNASTSRQTTSPLAYYAWPVPPAHTDGGAALRLIAEILAEPEGSQLRASLAAGNGHARDLRVWTFPHMGPSALAVQLRVEPRGSVDMARTLLERELHRLSTQGPTEAELLRAKQRVRRAFDQDLSTSASRAALLAEHELWSGDARLALTEPDRFAALTRAEVRLAAAQHLIETRRTTVEIYPPGWPQDPPPTVIRREHLVKAGENLIQIAHRYHSSVDAIAEANRIRSHRFIFPGQKLIVPVKTAEAEQAKRRTYTVKPGDSLSVIAKRHGVSTAALAEANRRRRDQRIVIGETLNIPAAPRAQVGGPGRKGKVKQHRVGPGDTLIGIAKRYGVAPKDLAEANGKDPKRPIRLGESLVIPSRSAAGAKPRSR